MSTKKIHASVCLAAIASVADIKTLTPAQIEALLVPSDFRSMRAEINDRNAKGQIPGELDNSPWHPARLLLTCEAGYYFAKAFRDESKKLERDLRVANEAGLAACNQVADYHKLVTAYLEAKDRAEAAKETYLNAPFQGGVPLLEALKAANEEVDGALLALRNYQAEIDDELKTGEELHDALQRGDAEAVDAILSDPPVVYLRNLPPHELTQAQQQELLKSIRETLGQIKDSLEDVPPTPGDQDAPPYEAHVDEVYANRSDPQETAYPDPDAVSSRFLTEGRL